MMSLASSLPELPPVRRIVVPYYGWTEGSLFQLARVPTVSGKDSCMAYNLQLLYTYIYIYDTRTATIPRVLVYEVMPAYVIHSI